MDEMLNYIFSNLKGQNKMIKRLHANAVRQQNFNTLVTWAVAFGSMQLYKMYLKNKKRDECIVDLAGDIDKLEARIEKIETYKDGDTNDAKEGE